LDSTLDRELQQATKSIVEQHAQSLTLQGISNAAVLLVDNRSFDVLAYVGNAQWSVANDTGYAVGLTVGKAKKQGSWQAGYLWQDLEADAVLGLLTDSDFAGGGTDSKGSKFSGAYALTDASKLKLTYFLAERQDSNGIENGGDSFDRDTLQLDFEFKYK